MDALDLARWQFGITTVYHFLFVPLTIGLGVFVAGLQTAWHRTGKEHYLRLTKFFGKLFLINFAMGVVTGIVQEFQFGMNWSEYSIFVGDVFGAPLALEALLAFFLESTFIGLWIFGWDKLPKRVHLATIWIAVIGSNLSAYFILAANAWMKHPVGYEVVDGRARMTDLWAVLTNSTALAQVPHVIAGSFVVAGGFVLAVCGYNIMRERRAHPGETTPHGTHEAHGTRGTTSRALLPGGTGPARRDGAGIWRTPMRAALLMTAIAGALVAGTGDLSAKLLHEQQPMKLAAAEGLERDTAGAPFSPVPGVEVPMLLSFLATNDPNAVIQGTEDLQARFEKQFGPGDYRPNLPVVFWSFRVMIVFGLSTVGLSVLGLWLTRGRRRDPRPPREVPDWFARICLPALPLPPLAMIAGWLLSEVGRQPWTVQGELLTAASVSPGVSLTEVAVSLAVFTALYGALALAEVVLLVRYVKAGPEPTPVVPVPSPPSPRDSRDDDARLQPTLMY
ncbi:cytochrome d ubiquinol oxidase subunit I [Streptosporangium becharense]|uniref:Cytochrome d ubiquinol oxidase subunit I n=1 Tax=Streptosporangium becharense TaxID=1816182 RepID=A0A7W9MIX0_9ACTN|nr:cytochrome ubiquinol oxidase subunit I [Streptosporangium becharense]MBB2911737.1 cytochrome d ubiquinol oxidase subunit I [Streptosporangium becharense]MBB5822445.1 cytochrome d ubiquinol oxidase subunit I [Streptosporangium becharense]